MAFIGFRVPHDTSRIFGDIEVPGSKVSENSIHITLLFLGDELDIDTLAEAVKVTYAVTSKTKPFSVRTTRVMSFPVDEGQSHPVIARIDSDALYDLRGRLAQAFDDAGVKYSKKFPNYQPHVTLAYADEAVDEFNIPTIEWGAHELVMWGGDDGDRKLVVTYPLALMPQLNETASKVANRYLLAGAL